METLMVLLRRKLVIQLNKVPEIPILRAHAGCEQKDEKVEDRGSSAMEPQLNGKSVDPRLSCNICDKAFTAVQSMMRHKRAIHGVSSLSTRHRNVTCQECMQSFVSLSKLREHLFQVHGTEVKKVYHEFSSAREFMEWKNRLEADIGVNYTIQRGSRKTPYGSKLVYYCRRSGLERVSSQAAQENKRSPKSQGTCKMGHFCTSSIEVETIDETIHVTYFALFHHDHNLNLSDLVHMKLTKHDKDRIVGIITRGFSYKNILDRVRKTSERSRASLLGRKDIENVDVAYGLKQIQFQHPEDSEVDTCDSDKTTARQGQGEEYGMPCMDIVKVEIEEHEEAEEKIGVRGKNRDTVKDQAVVYPVTTTTTGAAGTNTLRLKKQRKTPLNNEQDHQQQQQPLLSSVAELCNRLLAAEKGDEFHQFGLNVAAQLRAMPLRASLKAQLEIQKTLTAKRFQSMKR
ncbi:hypothetical protein Pcinc_015058 [Petrolisthes cinctipes]|uniref:C2H2-type domain-containing protein n=1 Tax=Petrolisthes cinctipes TaxID=88211 RepID=A0AAE1FVS8_PETCI|nr:hypothetical protein Pcinc_015058 [Petrolisthes cinctipes]